MIYNTVDVSEKINHLSNDLNPYYKHSVEGSSTVSAKLTAVSKYTCDYTTNYPKLPNKQKLRS